MIYHISFSLILAAVVLTDTKAQRCMQVTQISGDGYEVFYNVNDFTHTFEDPDVIFEMHFAIQAARDAHVLLSPRLYPAKREPVYEIAFGAGRNTFIDLRGNLKENSMASKTDSDIISDKEFRSFYIKINKDGLIVIGKEGEEKPMISYIDKTPLQIKYFSFGGFDNTKAKFAYDCAPLNPNESSTRPLLLEVTETTSSDNTETSSDFVMSSTESTVEEDPFTKTTNGKYTDGSSSPVDQYTGKIEEGSTTEFDPIIEEDTTENIKTVNHTAEELIPMDLHRDSKINETKVCNENKDEIPHISTSITIDKSGTVSASMGPLTRVEASLIPPFGMLIAAIAKEVHEGYVPSPNPLVSSQYDPLSEFNLKNVSPSCKLKPNIGLNGDFICAPQNNSAGALYCAPKVTPNGAKYCSPIVNSEGTRYCAPRITAYSAPSCPSGTALNNPSFCTPIAANDGLIFCAVNIESNGFLYCPTLVYSDGTPYCTPKYGLDDTPYCTGHCA